MQFMTPIRAAMAAAVAAVALTAPVHADTWRGWNIHPKGYPNTTAIEKFATDVDKATDGKLSLKVYNGGILGDQSDAIEQLRAGALEFANFNLGPMGPVVPMTDVLSLPYLFKSPEQMHHVMDGPIGKEFAAAMEKKGIVVLSWYDGGSRSFYNTKHPIETPADMKGLKLRVMNNDLYVQMVAQLGGNATPMAYGEVYQALKTGVIDGAENNFPSYDSSNHYEVAKYYSVDDHLILPECLCISKKAWDKLDPALQDEVRKAAIASADDQRKLWAEDVKKSEAQVKASGVKVNTVKDKAAFQDAMKPIYAKFETEHPEFKKVIEQIQATE
ncbi:TRAP transporter substrate-binding protein [Acidimangrovimonas sediminis]|uniref:TRAP transporter substrate-binding protein n=1 Tax=Acidimangrovimonas sediminis TaxID=2056283 RepID=UPI000C80F5BE|nr:TRAP transporter substrate-binding protein [Acidimangrovimonas sediminis]